MNQILWDIHANYIIYKIIVDININTYAHIMLVKTLNQKKQKMVMRKFNVLLRSIILAVVILLLILLINMKIIV